MFSRLEGMFAFCVWDREHRLLWLVRDRIGFRTLYYTTSGETRWIAPRLINLRNSHSTDLDLVALRDYLCSAFVPGEQTLWQQVRELTPGIFLHFPQEKVKTYWQVKEQVSAPGQPLEWYGQELRSLLNRVVREYLPINEPVGVF